MRSAYIAILAGVFIACLLAWGIASDPGYVHIRFADWRIEANVLVFIGAILLVMALIAFISKLLRRTLGIGIGVQSWLRNHNQRRASKKTDAGLLAYLEGNWSEASKLLRSSATHASTPVVNYIAAARAANENGDSKAAQQLLQKAYEETDDSEFSVGLAKAQLELEQDELESSLATLVRLQSIKPEHPFVLKLLAKVYTRLEDWKQLLQLMPELRRRASTSDKKELRALEEQAWHHVFSQRADELERQNRQSEAPDSLAKHWRQLPDNLRFQPDIIDAYASQLIRLNFHAEAETLLRKMINKDWSDQLVARYGCAHGKDLDEQLLQAEKWLKERPANPTLLLSLGRIAMRKQDWGKAQEYLQASLKQEASQDVYAELCRLELHTQEGSNSEHLQGLLQQLERARLPTQKRLA